MISLELVKQSHNPNNIGFHLLLYFSTIKNSRSLSDILGMFLSLVCAIQCALAPIILSIAPIVPSWAHFGHGWLWISFIVLIAAWSIGRGYTRHKNITVVNFALLGIGFLLLGTLLEGKLSVLMESAVFVTGGVLLTIAHWKNYKLEKSC